MGQLEALPSWSLFSQGRPQCGFAALEASLLGPDGEHSSLFDSSMLLQGPKNLTLLCLEHSPNSSVAKTVPGVCETPSAVRYTPFQGS